MWWEKVAADKAAAAVAGAGELNLVVIGVVLQMLSMATESTRLVLVQLLLQVRPAPCPSLHHTCGSSYHLVNKVFCNMTSGAGTSCAAVEPMCTTAVPWHRRDPTLRRVRRSGTLAAVPCHLTSRRSRRPDAQRRGLKLNPITSLYYIAPCCFGFLLLPFLMFELPKIRNDPAVVISIPVLLSNAAAAFGAPPPPPPPPTPHPSEYQSIGSLT